MPDEQRFPISKQLTNWYCAQVRRIYDGDTFHCDIQLGLGVELKHQRLRIARINSPEIKGRSRMKGLEARDFLIALINGKEILINAERKGKYGRWVAEVWFYDYETGWMNVSDLMLKGKKAKPLASH